MTKSGFEDIRLKSSLKDLKGFRKIPGTIYAKQFSFRPEAANFYYPEDLDICGKDLPFKLDNLFVGCDKHGIIQRIKLFVRGKRKIITSYLDSISNVKPSEVIYYENGVDSNRELIWNTNQNSSILFSDLSYIYGEDFFTIDFYETTDVQTFISFTITKWPRETLRFTSSNN